tara:strand:+ start:1438 stop:2040 length:603 start_codon:yes stop_codon:yes gene_type:complete
MQLERHAWRLGNRLDSLADNLRRYEAIDLNNLERFTVERTVIQLQIEWEHFVRAVILDSATGKYRSKSGPVSSGLPLRVLSREHASFVLIEQYHRRRNEPDWYLPFEAIQAAGKLSLTNEGKIATELGISPWKLDDLRFLRNFIAHRSGRSAKNVRSVGCVSKAHRIIPSEICFDFQIGGTRRYEGWVAFMKSAGFRLVE